MSRALRVVAHGDDVAAALADALAGGDAILPAAPGARHEAGDLPATVDDDVALVVETSGSTGRPKRVALSADALRANADASAAALGGHGGWVLALPAHYIAGLNVLARAAAAGRSAAAVAPVAGEGFTPRGFLDAAASLGDGPRFVALVPAQLRTLLDDAEAASALAGFARVLVGGQATPRALLADAADAGVRVVRSYGSSETSGGCVYDGAPIGATRVAIVDGEVRLGGPGLALGYLGDAALTAERFVEHDGMRWFRTADGGHLGADGRLVVTGRLDDVLVSGGVKVALAAVERVLREQPGLDDAVVVRAPHARWGEAPVAFTARGIPDDAAAVAAVGAQLGPAARPARIVRLDALPLLASGKVDRRALEAAAREAGT